MTQQSVSIVQRLRNSLIAIAAVVLSLAIFWGVQAQATTPSLEDQAEQAMPLEAALSNGKPTLAEFYANWCTTCQAMAKDLGQLKQNYAQSLNFVMLNVDNSKWLPEILRFRVDGIPHFVYFDRSGQPIAEAIGQQPRAILDANLAALVGDRPLPYTYQAGRVSQLEGLAEPSSSPDDPRSHGAQVQPQVN
ncbi:MAG: thioredoxin fold domain-containing protein [Chloroflexaceae bacterium]|nr:thioredoxin fold domain-containing protein [Chloroflexaceae bacterium]